jgi:hypothetical protein
MERRAFGEFISHRGELASYAFGWTTGAERRIGRLTVGIGVGNPGGASFHAEVAWQEGGHAFQLVDEVFEDVPEGGPDLTADQARAHDALEFVWAVADRVMWRDRRAWWLLHWLRGTLAISTAEVFAREEPILLVVNDDDDELWQLIGASDAGPDGRIGHLHHAVDEDQTLLDVLDLDPGEEALRHAVGGEWLRRPA